MKNLNSFFDIAKSVWAKSYPYLRNKYIFTLIFFFTWMLFFDRNDIVTRIKIKRQISKLKAEKEFYLREINQIEEINKQLFSSDEALEKFAREKYLMKRDNEEIFLITSKK